MEPPPHPPPFSPLIWPPYHYHHFILPPPPLPKKVILSFKTLEYSVNRPDFCVLLMARLTGFHFSSICALRQILCALIVGWMQNVQWCYRTVLSAPVFEVVYACKLTTQNMRCIIASTRQTRFFFFNLHQTNQCVLRAFCDPCVTSACI